MSIYKEILAYAHLIYMHSIITVQTPKDIEIGLVTT